METETTPTDRAYVAYRVRYQLRHQKKSQAWLACELGHGAMWMSRRLRGEVAFDVEEIQRVADALNVEVACFFPPTPMQRHAS